MIVKSLVPPPKSPIRIRSLRRNRSSYAYAAATGSYSNTISSKPTRRIAASSRPAANASSPESGGFEKCTGRPRMIRRGAGHDENSTSSLICRTMSAISFSSV